jgi:hypothetical protein
MVETLVLKDAVIFARNKGVSKVVFEVDCEILVRQWHDRVNDRSMIEQVLDEISELSMFYFF